MGNQQNNDPILRVVLVVFVGLLVFGFLFGFNFGGTGQAGMGHHGGMAATSGGGYYFGGLIAGLISFLIHILMLVLVFALIAGLFIAVKKFITTQDGLMEASRSKVKEARSQVMDAVNQDPVLKTLLMVIAGIAGFYFIVAIFRSFDGVGYGFSPYFMLFALVGFLLKLLMIGFVVALTMALVQYLKAQFNGGSRQEINVTPGAAPQASAIGQNNGKPEDKSK